MVRTRWKLLGCCNLKRSCEYGWGMGVVCEYVQKSATRHLNGLTHEMSLELVVVEVVEWRRPPGACKVTTKVPIWQGGVTEKHNPILPTLQHLRCCEEASIVKVSARESICCANCGPCRVIAWVGIITESGGTFGLKPSPTVRGKIPDDKMGEA
jgi:hypothetical protein